ncbi:MAG: alpha-galactosidase, partial [Planctomycetes bacterium]|nr:alpha-galactosidase [Planctomycetota bacterium]
MSFTWAILLASAPSQGAALRDGGAAGGDLLLRRDPIAARAEIEAAAVWAQEHLLGKAASVPFTFIYDGRPSSELLGSWERTEAARDLDARRREYTISYSDPRAKLACTCVAIVYRDAPAVDWVLRFQNRGPDETRILERIEPLDVAIVRPAPCAITLHRSLGDSNSKDSFKPIDEPLSPAAKVTLAPRGGRSSDPHMPFFNLDWQSGGVAIAVGWSGQWEAEFAGAGDRAVKVRAGMQLTRLRLRPGESIRTPRILAVFWEGGDPIRGNHVMRRTILEEYAPRRDGRPVLAPICGSVNETDPDGSYEGPHLRVIVPLAKRGVEVLWSDMDPQQWYPGGFPTGTGTWEVDPAKYPRGLEPIGDAARAAGLEYLLWFEPERVHPGTRIDREKPQWVMRANGEWSQLFAMHIPEARAWITELVGGYVAKAKLSWIRWDFNIDPLGFWRRADAPDRQGMTEIRYIEGLYAMWDELIARHPGLVIDQCASGGRRLDLESLSRGIPLWHSDSQCSGPNPAADQLQNAGLWRWLPMHGCGNFGLEPGYVFRSGMTTGNILCVGDDKGHLSTANRETEAAVERTVAIYRTVRPYFLGDFY